MTPQWRASRRWTFSEGVTPAIRARGLKPETRRAVEPVSVNAMIQGDCSSSATIEATRERDRATADTDDPASRTGLWKSSFSSV